MRNTLGMLLFAICSFPVLAQDISLDNFIKQGDFLDISISPTGKYLAARARYDEQLALVILDRATQQVVGGVRSQEGNDVYAATWVSEDRLIYKYAEKAHYLDAPIPTGELYAMNFDGSGKTILAGYRASDAQTGSRLNHRNNSPASFELLHVLPDDPRHVLVIEYPWTQEGKYWYDRRRALPIVSRLNIFTGQKRRVEVLPFRDPELGLSSSGDILFASWRDDDAIPHVASRSATPDEWTDLPAITGLQPDAHIVGMNQTKSLVYMLAPQGKPGYMNIFEVNLKQARARPLFKDLDADLLHWTSDPATGQPIIAQSYRHKARYHYADNKHPLTQLHQKLAKAFGGQPIHIASISDDLVHVLVHVSSDINPGEYYYFNSKTNKADFIWANYSWIDPGQMQPMQTVDIPARDGLALPTRLTMPKTKGKAPLIVMIHGGPHGVFAPWAFDHEAQLFANRGWAVLQVNYRGSGAFGQEFELAGHQQWGGKIIDDLIDATRWALQHKPLDASRVCAYGASFGAYAAMMLAARAPELLTCSAGYVGIYDLPLLYTDGDIPKRWGGTAYIKQAVGEDPALLKAFSPITHADKIKAKVLLIHGAEDQRAPIKHAEAMRKALKKAGKPVEWLMIRRSGHGAWEFDKRREMYEKLLSFLSKNLDSPQHP